MAPKKTKGGRQYLASGGRLKGTRNSRFKFESGESESRPLSDGYTGLTPTNTSTVDNDPSQAITRAKDADKKIAPSVATSAPTPGSEGGGKTQTVTDGKTKVKSSYIPGQPGKHEPNDVSAGARQAYFNQHGNYPPCINPDCKSYGHPHPNCLCYGPTSTQAGWSHLAQGGEVEHFCSGKRMHHKDCGYYKKGGTVVPVHLLAKPIPKFQDDPETVLDHAANDQGLLGILKDTGHTYPSFDHDKHIKILQDAKEQHAARTNPMQGMVEPKKTLGNKLGDDLADHNFDDTSEMMAGHPLTGTISPTKLKPIMERMAEPLLTQDPNPEAFRGSVNYLKSSMHGKNKLHDHVNRFFDEANDPDEDDHESTEELKNHLEDLQDNPHKALSVGGNIGHYLPMHAAALGSKTAQALNYFRGLRPQKTKSGPLDEEGPIDESQNNNYHRQLAIANNPMLIIKHAKKGSLLPSDLATVHNLYPKLADHIKAKLSEQLVDHKAKDGKIPYHLRQSLSMLLGQPMDSTMNVASMQAIMKSAGTQQAMGQGPKKATAAELKQLNKVDEMSKTSLDKEPASEKS